MPIKIPAELPAYRALDGENIFVMTDERAERQDIRPLEIVIVNLMPTKISTETQLLRLLGNSPLQVNITLLRTAEHVSAHTPAQHLERFYQTFEEIRDRSFDGMVVTGRRRRLCTISMACPSTSFRANCQAFSNTACFIPPADCFEALTTCFVRPIPGIPKCSPGMWLPRQG